MKKIVLFMAAALLTFSCNVSKTNPKEPQSPPAPVEYRVTRSGLMAEFLLDGDSILDTSDNNNVGTIYGPFKAVDRFGQAGKAYSFDGIDDYIRVENHSTLHSDRGLTVTGWLNVAGFPREWQVIFWKGDTVGTPTASQREYGLWLRNTGMLHFNSTPVDGTKQISYNTAPALVDAGKWTHFVCIVDNDKGEMRLYLNGKLVEDVYPDDRYGNGNIKTSNGPFILGNSGLAELSSNVGFFKGSLDDIRIYNRVLSESEILELYKAQ